jgi:hypothetical protein
MKGMLLPAAVAVGVLSVAGAAWSSGVLGGGPAQFRVYGGGQISTPAPVPTRTISLDAAANPQGVGAYGTLRYAAAAGGFRGEVSCLSVDGNTALVGGFVREGPSNFVGLTFLYAVSDNGPPGSGADRAGFIDVGPDVDTPPYPGLPANFPSTCPSASGAQDNLGAFPLTGDVSIERP